MTPRIVFLYWVSSHGKYTLHIPGSRQRLLLRTTGVLGSSLENVIYLPVRVRRLSGARFAVRPNIRVRHQQQQHQQQQQRTTEEQNIRQIILCAWPLIDQFYKQYDMSDVPEPEGSRAYTCWLSKLENSSGSGSSKQQQLTSHIIVALDILGRYHSKMILGCSTTRAVYVQIY